MLLYIILLYIACTFYFTSCKISGDFLRKEKLEENLISLTSLNMEKGFLKD